MAQITHETVNCIEAAFERKDPDGGFPLTSWEKVQLARAWVDRNLLADAIAKAAQRAGIYNGEATLTGPQLVQLCEDLASTAGMNSVASVGAKEERNA
jgi:hypothetical protein